MFLLYLVLFVLIAGSLGAIAAIVVANVFPEAAEDGAGVSSLAVVVAGGVVLAVRLWRTPGDTLDAATGWGAC